MTAIIISLCWISCGIIAVGAVNADFWGDIGPGYGPGWFLRIAFFLLGPASLIMAVLVTSMPGSHYEGDTWNNRVHHGWRCPFSHGLMWHEPKRNKT